MAAQHALERLQRDNVARGTVGIGRGADAGQEVEMSYLCRGASCHTPLRRDCSAGSVCFGGVERVGGGIRADQVFEPARKIVNRAAVGRRDTVKVANQGGV